MYYSSVNLPVAFKLVAFSDYIHVHIHRNLTLLPQMTAVHYKDIPSIIFTFKKSREATTLKVNTT